MATANDLITRALRSARVLGMDQVPSAEVAADALAELNAMLDEWWVDSLAVFHILQENFALVAGQATRTIGPAGQFVTTRPLELLDGCFVRRNGKDFGLTVLRDRAIYDEIIDKTVTGLPEYVFYDAAVPAGTLYFFPVPDQADQVYLNSPARLQSVATLVTTMALPPAYDRLVVNSLAIALAPRYGLEAPPSVKTAFSRTMRIIKRKNAPSLVMSLDSALLPVSQIRYNIRTG